MTLILSYWNAPTTLLMVGDLLLTTNAPQGVEAAPPLPSRFSPLQDPVGNHVVRLQQKIIILKDNMVAAWAGNASVAACIMRIIRDHSDKIRSGDDILEMINNSGLSNEELDSVAFIFFVALAENNIFVQDYMTKEHCFSPTHKFKFAGSGDWHYFETISFNYTSVSGGMDQLRHDIASIIGRAAIAFHQEITSDILHNFWYGGGFEILGPGICGKTFGKLPYSYSYWGFKGEEIRLIGPIMAYDYHESGLLQIDRFEQTGSGWKHTPFLVGNFFCRPDGVAINPPSIPVGPMIHYLIDYENPSDQLSFTIETGQRTVFLQNAGRDLEIVVDFDSAGFNDIKEGVARARKGRESTLAIHS